MCSERVRSSGLIISTGSGSTAWLKTMNNLNKDNFISMIQALNHHAEKDQIDLGDINSLLHPENSPLVDQIMEKVNGVIIFSPESDFLQFRHRELVDGISED